MQSSAVRRAVLRFSGGYLSPTFPPPGKKKVKNSSCTDEWKCRVDLQAPKGTARNTGWNGLYHKSTYTYSPKQPLYLLFLDPSISLCFLLYPCSQKFFFWDYISLLHLWCLQIKNKKYTFKFQNRLPIWYKQYFPFPKFSTAFLFFGMVCLGPKMHK